MVISQAVTSTNVVDARAGIRGRLTTLLSAGGAYRVLILLAFVMDARRLAAPALDGVAQPSLAGALQRIDALSVAEWLLILGLAYKADFSALKPRLAERVAGLALAGFALYGLFVADALWRVPMIVLCVAVAVRLAFVRRLWPLAACLLLVSRQWINPMFRWLHELSIAVDAQATHLVLWLSGFPNQVHGAVLRLDGSAHAINILGGCNSLHELWPVVAAFGILVFATGKPLNNGMLTRLIVLVVAVFAINWLRLGIMALSLANYHYWHTGTGSSIIAAAYTVLVLAMAGIGFDAKRRGDAQPPAA